MLGGSLLKRQCSWKNLAHLTQITNAGHGGFFHSCFSNREGGRSAGRPALRPKGESSPVSAQSGTGARQISSFPSFLGVKRISSPSVIGVIGVRSNHLTFSLGSLGSVRII